MKYTSSPDIEKLIIAFLENNISSDHLSILEKELQSNAEAIDLFRDYSEMYCILYKKSNLVLDNNPLNEKQNDTLECYNITPKDNDSSNKIKMDADIELHEFLQKNRSKKIKEQYNASQDSKPGFFQGSFLNTVTKVAACLILGIIIWASLPQSSNKHIATIHASSQAQWQNKSLKTIPGTQLSAQSYELVSGSLELMFNDGAIVVFNAPATFNLMSSNSTYLEKGRLLANVPSQAIGFTVETPNTTIVDLGTKFSVYVDDSGQSECHVQDGVIECISKLSSISQKLLTGQSVRVLASGEIENIATTQLSQSHAVSPQQPVNKNTTATKQIEASHVSNPDIEFNFETSSSEYGSILNEATLTTDLNNNSILQCNGQQQCFKIQEFTDEFDSTDLTISFWATLKSFSPQNIMIIGQQMPQDDIGGLEITHQLYLNRNQSDNSLEMVFGYFPKENSHEDESEFDEDDDEIKYNDNELNKESNSEFELAKTTTPFDQKYLNGFHVAITDSEHQLDIYINGRLATTQTNPISTIIDKELTIYFGGSNADIHEAKTLPAFAGSIDDVMIYNRILSNADISALYQSLKK